MSQSRAMSLVEAKTNAVIGLAVSWLFTLFGLPFFGLEPSPQEATGIAAAYFLLSTMRSYLIRRAFAAGSATRAIGRSVAGGASK